MSYDLADVNVDCLFFSQTNNPLFTGMFQTPAMQNFLQQVSDNPQMLQNTMQSPYMQQMMTQMMQNPELMATVSKPVLTLSMYTR